MGSATSTVCNSGRPTWYCNWINGWDTSSQCIDSSADNSCASW
jgi:hypothetical protein